MEDIAITWANFLDAKDQLAAASIDKNQPICKTFCDNSVELGH